MKRASNPDRLPHNTEIERANLERMLVHPEQIPEYRSILAPRDFADYFNRQIYEAILAAQDAGAPLDGNFVCAVRARLTDVIREMPKEVIGAHLGRLIQP